MDFSLFSHDASTRRARIVRALAASTLAVLLAGAPVTAGATSGPFLRYASDWASYSYKLKLVKTCQVGDGLAVVKDVATAPLRITAISVLYGDGARADEEHTTYELISLRRGTSEGQLAATFHLSAIKGGVDLGNAVGAQIEPIKAGGLSYDIEAKVLVVENHVRAWKIKGLRVSYDVGSRAYSTVLAQSVTLSATSVCI